MLQRLMSLTPVRGDVPLGAKDGPFKVALLGSGNWGTTVATLMAENTACKPFFKAEVTMWVYEEQVDGRNLSEIINQDHENVKYLPGVRLPDNVVAEPDVATACAGANVLVFCMPHQFLTPKMLEAISGAMASDAFAVSLIKGVDFDEDGKLVLLSDIIQRALNVDTSVLMGANVASEIAAGDFAEATVGGSLRTSEVLRELFHTRNFHVAAVRDKVAVELCGALKNIVALGAGFVDGLSLGGNSKGALIRLGLKEMGRFIEMQTGAFPHAVLLESCGIADLITTCAGGRNRKVAEAFVRTGKSWDELEAELLNGQKLQGTLTSKEIQRILSAANAEASFPLFTSIHKIAFEGASPATIFSGGIEQGELA